MDATASSRRFLAVCLPTDSSTSAGARGGALASMAGADPGGGVLAVIDTRHNDANLNSRDDIGTRAFSVARGTSECYAM